MLQTIGNNIDGGESGGRTIREYKSISPFVMRAEKPPTANGIAILIRKRFKLNFKIILTPHIILYAELNDFIIKNGDSFSLSPKI